MIRSLMDADLIIVDQEKGTCELVAGIDEFPFPDSLHAVLLARIDRLPEAPRQTLDLASVLGRQFDLDLLSQVVGSIHEGFMVSTNLLVRTEDFYDPPWVRQDARSSSTMLSRRRRFTTYC